MQITIITLLGILACIGLAGARPAITLRSLELEGVRLLPSTALEFRSALARSPAYDREMLLPYTVAIRNSSREDIIAYCILWASKSDEGSEVTQEQTIFDFHKAAPQVVLPIGTTRIAWPVSGLHSTEGRAGRTASSEIDTLRQFYEGRESLIISLEAVVFSSGRAAGTDSRQRVRMWRGMVDGRRDLVKSVLAQPESFEAGLVAARDEASTLLNEAQITGTLSGRLLRALYSSTSYEGSYTLAKAFFARELLDGIRANGVRETIEKLNNFRETARYPAIGR